MIQPHALLCLSVQERNLEPLEVRLTKDNLQRMIKRLQELRDLSQDRGSSEPDLGLFIIKQSFVTSGTPIQMRLIWPEQRLRAQSAGRLGRSQPRINDDSQPLLNVQNQLAYLKKASLVKHAITRDGFACLEFRVLKWREDMNGRPSEQTIHVLQNNLSFVTEVRSLSEDRIFEICHASIVPNGDGKCIKVIYFAANPETWILEFESLFKVFQFMQLL